MMVKKTTTTRGLPTPTPGIPAVVTGASQGIGRAIAEKLASRGYDVVLVARRKAVLEAFATDIQARWPVTAEVRSVDLSRETERAPLVEELAHRPISIIVNSAGIASFGPFLQQNWDYETTQFSLNATAVHELTHAVLPGMVERGEGAILNVGSVAGNIPIPNNATYVFTKAGVNAFTEALHYELKSTGVHCTLLAPGPVRESVKQDEKRSIVDRVVPDFLWTTYESCAIETLEALAANKRRVVPGPLSKAMNIISSYAPTALLAPIMGKIYAHMGEN